MQNETNKAVAGVPFTRDRKAVVIIATEPANTKAIPFGLNSISFEK